MSTEERTDYSCRIAEPLLAQSGQFLPTLMDAIPYPVIVRAPDYRVLLANRAALATYGEQILDGRCYHVCRGREAPCDDCPAGQSIRTRRNHRTPNDLPFSPPAPDNPVSNRSTRNPKPGTINPCL